MYLWAISILIVFATGIFVYLYFCFQMQEINRRSSGRGIKCWSDTDLHSVQYNYLIIITTTTIFIMNSLESAEIFASRQGNNFMKFLLSAFQEIHNIPAWKIFTFLFLSFSSKIETSGSWCTVVFWCTVSKVNIEVEPPWVTLDDNRNNNTTTH